VTVARQRTPAANNPPLARPTKVESYSIVQLARRWKYSKGDVEDLLCNNRWVPVYLHGKRIVAVSTLSGRQQTFRGYVLLIPESVVQILADNVSNRVEIDAFGPPVPGGPAGCAPFRVVDPAVWTTADLRVMRRDVEVLERQEATPEESLPIQRITNEHAKVMAKASAEKRADTRRERAPKLQQALDEYRTKHPHHDAKTAREAVAEQFGIRRRTVETDTKW
jgi:hypothetical protein